MPVQVCPPGAVEPLAVIGSCPVTVNVGVSRSVVLPDGIPCPVTVTETAVLESALLAVAGEMSLTGNVSILTQTAPPVYYFSQWYLGAYAADTWRVTPRVTFNYGLRWEPWFPMHERSDHVSHFDLAAFSAGTKSKVYTNAPAGLLFHGDPNIPAAYAGGSWVGFAPRFGVAWGVLYATVQGLAAALHLVMPDLMVKAWHWIKPDGFDGTLAAFFAVQLALAIYRWSRDTARASSFGSIGFMCPATNRGGWTGGFTVGPTGLTSRNTMRKPTSAP